MTRQSASGRRPMAGLKAFVARYTNLMVQEHKKDVNKNLPQWTKDAPAANATAVTTMFQSADTTIQKHLNLAEQANAAESREAKHEPTRSRSPGSLPSAAQRSPGTRTPLPPPPGPRARTSCRTCGGSSCVGPRQNVERAGVDRGGRRRARSTVGALDRGLGSPRRLTLRSAARPGARPAQGARPPAHARSSWAEVGGRELREGPRRSIPAARCRTSRTSTRRRRRRS